MERKTKKGVPFTIVDGEISDREIWEAEMDDELEARFDKFLETKHLLNQVRSELERRKKRQRHQENVNSIFKEYMKDIDPE